MGQTASVKILKKSIIEKDYPSAIVFSGPHGLGKTTLARIFSCAVLCASPENGNPCGKCDSCRLFKKEQHFGFRELDSASYGGKEDMKELRDENVISSLSNKKILLLDEAQDITKAGQDLLLKPIEESPEHLIIIFCTTNPEKIEPTLMDRCMLFQLSRVDSSLIVEKLKYVCEKEQFEFDEEALGFIAEKCKGHVRDSLNILQKTSYLGKISRDNLDLIYRDFEEEVFIILANLGVNLETVIKTYHSISNFISSIELYNVILSLVSDAAKSLYNYEDIPRRRKELVTQLKDIHGYSLLEFLNYLITRDKYIDKIGIQSDLIILHHKYSANNFVVQSPQKNSKIQINPKKEENNKTQSLSFSDLSKLDLAERCKILREQKSRNKKGQKEDPENIPTQWPLPKEGRFGENSNDKKVLSAQEFSQNLVGGRGAKKIKSMVDS